MAEIVGAILERVRAWESYASRWLHDFEDFEKRYRGERVGKGEGFGYANTNDLEFFRDVEAVVSSADSVLWGDDPPFVVRASVLEKEKEAKAAQSQALLERQIVEAGIRRKAIRAMRLWALNGTVVCAVPWKFSERWVDRGENYERVPMLDYPDLVPLSPWRFAFEPGALDPQDAEWVVEEAVMNEDQLASLVEAAQAMGNAEVRDLSVLNLKESRSAHAGEFAERVARSRGYESLGSRKYAVKKYWGRHPTERHPVDFLIVVVNDDEWVVQMPNPYAHGLKPYVKASFIEMDESFYGFGLGHILQEAHEEIIERNNLMQDLATMALYGAWRRRGGGVMPAERLLLSPGKVIDEMVWGQLEHMVPQLSVLGPGFQFNERKKEDMRIASAATTTQQALPSGETATEVRIIAGESARRIAGLTMQFADGIFRPWLFFAHEMSRQYLDREVIVQVSGRRIPVSRDGLVPDPDIWIKLAVDLDARPQMLRRLTAALQAMTQASEKAPSLEKYFEPTAKRFLALLGVDVRGLPEGPSGVITPAILKQELALLRSQMQPPPAAPGPAAFGPAAVARGLPPVPVAA